MNRLVAIALASALAAFAQTNRGGISGTVFDPTGAVVPNASVTITNLGTNQKVTEKTSPNGSYSVGSLDPVTYSVSVELAGFKKALIEQVKVDTATVTTVNATLQTGTVSTEVTVQAEAAAINTESGTTSSTVNERQIQDIPLVNRSVLDLALTQPNVMGDAGSEDPGLTAGATVPGFNLSVNGGRPGSSLIMADGVNNTGVSLGRAVVSFTPETVQEFTVLTSAFSAEYSQSGGGIIIATTKSGTNQLNGTFLWMLRNPYVNASPWTVASVNRPTSNLKWNQFSLTAGGPVVIPKIYNGRNKTFFFAAMEPRYRRDNLAQDACLPTDAMRAGDFSNLVYIANGSASCYVPKDVAARFGLTGTDTTIYQVYGLVNGNQLVQNATPPAGTTYLPFPGNVLPKQYMSSAALKSLPYITQAGAWYANSAGFLSNLFNPRLLRQDEKRYMIKIDQVISDKNRLSFRYNDSPTVKTQFTPSSPISATAEYNYAKQYKLQDTHTISGTVLNDLNISVTAANFSSTKAPQYEPFTGANLNAELGVPNITPGGQPYFAGQNTGGWLGSAVSTEAVNHESRFGLGDVLYVNRGAMSLKFGVDLSKSFQNVFPLYGASGGSYNFRVFPTDSNGGTSGTGGVEFATFLLGVPQSVALRNTLVPYYYRWNAGSGFIQNDWKVRPRLTINIGVRYTLQMPRTEKYDHQGVFLPDQAQSYSLSTPLTLADGRNITSVLVPPFAWVNRGGRDQYLYPADYHQFEPRFGFAWSPAGLDRLHLTMRGGYGLSHAPLTGSARLPNPDFGATTSYGANAGQTYPNYVMRLSENPPLLPTQPIDQFLNITGDGLNYLNSINYQGTAFAISPNVHTPYSQNWNFTLSSQLDRATTLEVAYVGNKGTHLFMPRQNINGKDVNYLDYLDSNNISTTATITDPLGRKNTNGQALTVTNSSLASPYLGFTALNMMYDASANSIRHAGYVSVVHRAARGLTFTSNLTMGKSIDDASDSGVDKNVLSTGRVDGQSGLGASRRGERSVSTYDQKWIWNTTFIYDLPFGRGRHFLNQGWKPLQMALGDWTVTGVARRQSGYPAVITMSDSNQLGDPTLTHTTRPNIVPGVPTVNPYYDRNCPVGANCQPYVNPSLFERPPLGQYGNAPRTLDGARGPWQQLFDASLQKNFRLGESKQRIQFRVDALNAFNHPVFKVYPNVGGGTDIFNNPPTATNPSNAEYNTWAAANSKPLQGTTDGNALLSQINATINGFRNASGVLPTNFFTVPLPANFWAANANSFDITTPQGYKYYRLRQQLGTAGQVHQFGQARYIQLGLKIFF